MRIKKITKSLTIPLRLSLLYTIFAVVWIFSSDRILQWFISDASLLALMQTYNVWAFVLVTALLLYVALRLCIRDAQATLKQSEEQFRRTLENIPHVVVIYDLDLRIRYINAVARRITGRPPSELIGKREEELWPPEICQAYLPTLQEALQTGSMCELETDLLIPETGRRSLKITYVPLLNEKGDIREILAITQDLTEHKEREHEYQELINGMNDSAYVIDFKGKFIEVNETAIKTLGYSREEFLLMGPTDIDPYLTAKDIRQLIEEMKSGERQVFETRHRTKTGEIIPIEISSSLIQYHGHLVILSMARDLSERKRAEAERERLMAAIEQSAEIVIITDLSGIIQYVNPAFEKTTGYSREEALGQTPRILKSGVQDGAFYRNMWETITAGRVWQGRIVNKRKDGDLFTEDATISPVFDLTGKIVNFVGVKRDISQELKLEQQYRQAQKMEAVGRLAGGVAHDLNNTLTIILGNTDLVLDEADPGQPIYAELEEIRTAAKRSVEITRQLLAFARKQTVAPEVIDLNIRVETMIKMLQRLIRENIKLNWRPGKDLWPVRIDPSQIDQILANLCVNARDAIADTGEVVIETGNVVFDEAYCAIHEEAIPGQYSMLAVSDNGCGMHKNVLAQVFEPFFTTKEIGKGTGLGLATVYGIVKQNQGFINIYSEPGQGTTVKIYLPRYAGEIKPVSLSGEAKVAGGQGETLLLVEDDPLILKLGKKILTGLGYNILAASTPSEALRLAQEHTNDIHLLITDVVMPEMNGQELAKRILAKKPNIKCLFMSGYAPDAITHNGILDKGVNFLQKPYTKKSLAEKIRETLNAAEA